MLMESTLTLKVPHKTGQISQPGWSNLLKTRTTTSSRSIKTTRSLSMLLGLRIASMGDAIIMST